MEDDEPREPVDVSGEEDEESPRQARDAELDEFEIAEREYLNEMRSGMHITEEDGVAI